MNVLYFLGAFFIIYILLMVRFYLLRNKAKHTISNMDKVKELKEAIATTSDFSIQNEPVLFENLNIRSIDAFTYGEIRYIPSAAENQTDQLASFSTVKTSSLYDYVMLKGANLYIYDNEFNKYVSVQDLNNANIVVEELSLDQGASRLKYYLPFVLKRYKLKAKVTDNLSVEIVLCNCLNYAAMYPGAGLGAFITVMKDCSQQYLQNYRTGNYFLKKLKEACPAAYSITTCFD